MRTLLVLTACVFFFGVGWAFGQQNGGDRAMDNSGPEWKALPEIARLDYAIGFSHGYSQGLLDGHVLSVVSTPEEDESFRYLQGREQPAPFLITDARARLKAVNSKSATYGTIINTMSDLYGDFRNAPVCWGDAFFLARESLAGLSPTDQDIARMRAADAQTGCIR